MPSVTSGARRYWAASRAPRYSVLFALPLLVLYELLAAALAQLDGASIRNGADVWLKTPFILLAGARGPLLFGALVLIASVALVWRDVRRHGGPLLPRVFALMLAESAVLALVCAVVVGMATAEVLHGLSRVATTLGASAVPRLAVAQGPAALDLPNRVALSLGAGLYEELLFRVVIVSTLAVGARRVLGLGELASGALATIGGALLFSIAHYVGAYGDPFTLQSFVFRLLAGLFFSALYLLRGFGIAAWTHALYDVGVML